MKRKSFTTGCNSFNNNVDLSTLSQRNDNGLLQKKLYDAIPLDSRPKRRKFSILPIQGINLFIIINQLFILVLFYLYGVPRIFNFNWKRETDVVVLATPKLNLEMKLLQKDILSISKKLDSLRAFNYAHRGNEIALKSKMKDLDTRISNAFNLYDADKIGLKDYALQTLGATIVSIPDTIPYSSGNIINLFGLRVAQKSNPEKILQPQINPGECFAFIGSTGKIRIKLSQKIKIRAFTLEHAHISLLDDFTSAPKDFIVYGLDDENSEAKNEIGEFTYEIQHECLQLFEVKEPEDKFYQHVELFITSNHGHKDYTSIYRFRVHGSLN